MLRQQLTEARKKADEGVIQHMEELKKKVSFFTNESGIVSTLVKLVMILYVLQHS